MSGLDSECFGISLGKNDRKYLHCVGGCCFVFLFVFGFCAFVAVTGFFFNDARFDDRCLVMNNTMPEMLDCDVDSVSETRIRSQVTIFAAIPPVLASVMTVLAESNVLLEKLFPAKTESMFQNGKIIEYAVLIFAWLAAIAIELALIIIAFMEDHTDEFIAAAVISTTVSSLGSVLGSTLLSKLGKLCGKSTNNNNKAPDPEADARNFVMLDE